MALDDPAAQHAVDVERTCTPHTCSRTQLEDNPSVLLNATLALANTQLLAQNDDEAGLDGQVMGLVAFNGTLLAANLGARALLGEWWFLPLIAITASTVLCLALTINRGGDVGPAAARFYIDYGRAPDVEASEQLLADLDLTFRRNARRIDAKERGVKVALGILLVGLVCSGLLATQAPTIRI